MPEMTDPMDLLLAMRDLGVDAPAATDAGDERCRHVLSREIDRAAKAAAATGRAPAPRRREALTAARPRPS
ncbi:MAG: hypothetical protein ACRDNS_21275, partial [Trebonia sp.]